MKYYFLFLQFIVINVTLSQNITNKKLEKTFLDTSVFSVWPSLYKFGISDDGAFAYFTITQGGSTDKQRLTVKSLLENWEISINDIKGAINFSSNNKKLFCLNSGDSLCILSIGDHEIKYIPKVISLKLFKNNPSNYLVYQKSSPSNEVTVFNITNNREVVFKQVRDYLIDIEGNNIVAKVDSLANGQNKEFLFWKKLDDGAYSQFIDAGNNLKSLVFSKKSDRLAFVKEINGQNSIWLYKPNEKPSQLLCDSNTSILKDLQIDRIHSFSQDGSKLFIYVIEKSLSKPKQDLVKLNVWSFTDAVVQSRQKFAPQSYLAVIDIRNGKMSRLQYKNDKLVRFDGANDNYLFLNTAEGEYLENHWSEAAIGKSFLVSTEDGSRKQFDNRFNDPKFSPDGQYLIGFDEKGTDIYSYEFETREIVNLTKTIAVHLPSDFLQRDIKNMPMGKYSRGLDFAAWGNENTVLIYDEFDIWRIDLKGRKAPINITNGFGRKNKIEFRLTNLNANKTVHLNDGVILSAFNRTNKNSGYYKILPGTNSDPRLLSMGNYKFTLRFGVQSPIKANEAEVYLVQRESATESPNLYWTSDFKTFNRLSSIFPEKEYNWLTSELISFKTLDGRIEQGVLYKPENFNVKNKYPAIIHCYENKSNNLNEFYYPNPLKVGGGGLDISWFVNHGYIVFTPDIHYKIGETGQSAYNSVIGAAKYLKSLTFINGEKIGIQGHSFGGFETNYLVAHSNAFAAAISSSGPSNFITAYLSDNPVEQLHCEVAQNRLGKSLWEDIPMYIQNSPVFKAFNVTTPILTVANIGDKSVPFHHGLEWFMALRRLGKRAWMLQYDNGGHGLLGNEYTDYLVRSTQFFDHYLKDSACPKWMLYGIPMKYKGIDDGLELVREKDLKTNKWLTPMEGGILTDEQKKKVADLKLATRNENLNK